MVVVDQPVVLEEQEIHLQFLPLKEIMVEQATPVTWTTLVVVVVVELQELVNCSTTYPSGGGTGGRWYKWEITGSNPYWWCNLELVEATIWRWWWRWWRYWWWFWRWSPAELVAGESGGASWWW